MSSNPAAYEERIASNNKAYEKGVEDGMRLSIATDKKRIAYLEKLCAWAYENGPSVWLAKTERRVNVLRLRAEHVRFMQGKAQGVLDAPEK